MVSAALPVQVGWAAADIPQGGISNDRPRREDLCRSGGQITRKAGQTLAEPETTPGDPLPTPEPMGLFSDSPDDFRARLRRRAPIHRPFTAFHRRTFFCPHARRASIAAAVSVRQARDEGFLQGPGPAVSRDLDPRGLRRGTTVRSRGDQPGGGDTPSITPCNQTSLAGVRVSVLAPVARGQGSPVAPAVAAGGYSSLDHSWRPTLSHSPPADAPRYANRKGRIYRSALLTHHKARRNSGGYLVDLTKAITTDWPRLRFRHQTWVITRSDGSPAADLRVVSESTGLR